MWFIVMKYMTEENAMSRHSRQSQFTRRYVRIMWR